MKVNTTLVTILFSTASLLYAQGAVSAVDADAAQALAKKEGCLKCHGVDKNKDAKSLKELSKNYKGKADADEKILFHITSGEKVKFENGKEEDHKIIKTKDKAAIDNLIAWFRSLAN